MMARATWDTIRIVLLSNACLITSRVPSGLDVLN